MNGLAAGTQISAPTSGQPRANAAARIEPASATKARKSSDRLSVVAQDEGRRRRGSVSEKDDGTLDATGTETAREVPRPRIQSVARAVDLLLWVAGSNNGMTSKALAERLQMSRQGTYHLLHTLISSGVLARTEDDRYVLGLRVGTLAAGFERHITAAEHLAPHVRALARETGETAYAAGWRHGEIVVLTVARGTNPVQAAEITPGTAGDAHARASGKLLLAQLSSETLDEFVQRHPLRPRTAATITVRRKLDAELKGIREQGYAVDREEFAEGLCCVAIPFDQGASPFVIGFSVPASRFASDDIPRYVAIAEDWNVRPR